MTTRTAGMWILYYALASLVVWLFHTYWVESGYLFLNILLIFLPGLFLALKHDINVKNNMLISILVTLPNMLATDPIATNDLAWLVPNSLFNWRIFGLTPIENLFCAFAVMFLMMVLFQKYMTEVKEVLRRMSIKSIILMMSPWLAVFISGTVLLAVTLHGNPTFSIPYMYLYIGISTAVAPTLVFVILTRGQKELRRRFIKASLRGILIIIVFNTLGIATKMWVYPGENYLYLFVTIAAIRVNFWV